MRADRFGQRAFQTGQGGGLEQDLAHPVGTKPGALNATAAIDLAEQRPGFDLGQFEPLLQRRNRAGFLSLSAWNGDFGAFALLGLSVICVQKVPLRKGREINALRHEPVLNRLKYRQIQLFAGSPEFCPSNERFPDGRILVR